MSINVLVLVGHAGRVGETRLCAVLSRGLTTCILGTLFAADRAAHKQTARIAKRLGREMPARPAHDTGHRPGIVLTERERRENLPAHVGWPDAVAGIPQAIIDGVMTPQPAEKGQAARGAIGRAVPAGRDRQRGAILGQ